MRIHLLLLRIGCDFVHLLVIFVCFDACRSWVLIKIILDVILLVLVVRIFLHRYLYAVTQHLLTRMECSIFNFPERFLEISYRDLIFSLC